MEENVMETNWTNTLGFNAFACFLFFLEVYHIVGHSAILFRVRLLPRKDLVKVRYYFLVDAMTVFVVSFIYTGKLRWLAVIQNIQHLYFFFTWNAATNSDYTNKVISWSSLDWVKDNRTNTRKEWDVFLGTLFDVIVHVINAYILSQYMNSVELVVGMLAVGALSYAVLFSSRFAWSSPESVPTWVEKRVKPVTKSG